MVQGIVYFVFFWMKSGLPFLLMFAVSCSAPTEFPRDNPVDPTGDAFDIPDLGGLTSTRVDRHIKLTWTESFDRHRIFIERSLDEGPFVLADSLESGVKTWTDTTVAFPDSIVYQYRVFGRYLDIHTDTLLSYRITSDLNITSITSAYVRRDIIILQPMTISGQTVLIADSTQTFFLARDSIAVFVEYPNLSQRHLSRIPDASFVYPKESEPVRFVIRQYSKGREIFEWKTGALTSRLAFGENFDRLVGGTFLRYPFHYIAPTGKATFLYRKSDIHTADGYTTCVYTFDVTPCSTSFRYHGLVYTIIPATPGHIAYNTSNNEARLQSLTEFESTRLNVPDRPMTLGAYYETGELVYIRHKGAIENPLSVDRYNAITQTPISSFTIPDHLVVKLVDFPDKNEIWVFSRGLMRLNRTTGAVIQDFDSDTDIFRILIKEGKGYATFAMGTPFVKIYDMETGAVETLPIPEPYSEIFFLTDGRHVLLVNNTDYTASLIAYDLIDQKIVGVTADFGSTNDAFFFLDPNATLEQFVFSSTLLFSDIIHIRHYSQVPGPWGFFTP
jgi:hypothetical protein